MLTVTDDARKELDAYFDGKEKGAIRIFLAQGGCSGPRLALALDEPSDEDTTFDQAGYQFCVNKALLEAAKTVTIDCSAMGFTVESEVSFGGGGGCASCGGGCGEN
jgi:Uncharacterized conserved protein